MTLCNFVTCCASTILTPSSSSLNQTIQALASHAGHVLSSQRLYHAGGCRCRPCCRHLLSTHHLPRARTATVTLCSGLVPSAVLNVEFPPFGGSIVSRSSGGATAGSAASVGQAESWPAWLLRLGLTAIMLPFRLVGAFFGTQQTYDPLPQSAAAEGGRAPTRSSAPSSVRNARQDKPVEFYNGTLHLHR
jgi:hypothetical protein